MSAPLPVRLMHEQAQACCAQLVSAIESSPAGAAVEVDAGALEHFDSSALAVILEARRRAAASGRTVVLVDPPPRLQSLARLYGIDKLVL